MTRPARGCGLARNAENVVAAAAAAAAAGTAVSPAPSPLLGIFLQDLGKPGIDWGFA